MDLTPLVSPLLQVLAVVASGAATALLGLGIGWVKKKTNLADAEFESVLADRANDIVNRGIQYAITAMENEAKKPGSSITTVRVDNVFMRIALDYIVRAMPGIIEQFGLTPDRIREMIMARIGDYSGLIKTEGAAAQGQAVVTATQPVAQFDERSMK